MDPHTSPPAPSGRLKKIALTAAIVGPATLVGLLVLLRLFGLLVPYSTPVGSMHPAVSAGDQVLMEGVTYLFREPRRGDIVTFKTDGLAGLDPGAVFVKRVAGEPGDHLRLADGKLFINGTVVNLENSDGVITHTLPPRAERSIKFVDLTIPEGCYFLLGDNTQNSYDSRAWGPVPRGNITGRVPFRYWPFHRIGSVK